MSSTACPARQAGLPGQVDDLDAAGYPRCRCCTCAALASAASWRKWPQPQRGGISASTEPRRLRSCVVLAVDRDDGVGQLAAGLAGRAERRPLARRAGEHGQQRPGQQGQRQAAGQQRQDHAVVGQRAAAAAWCICASAAHAAHGDMPARRDRVPGRRPGSRCRPVAGRNRPVLGRRQCSRASLRHERPRSLQYGSGVALASLVSNSACPAAARLWPRGGPLAAPAWLARRCGPRRGPVPARKAGRRRSARGPRAAPGRDPGPPDGRPTRSRGGFQIGKRPLDLHVCRQRTANGPPLRRGKIASAEGVCAT